ncbi:hypothetical protein Hanom_Chr06g00572951 [Helianthus anomalus]
MGFIVLLVLVVFVVVDVGAAKESKISHSVVVVALTASCWERSATTVRLD